MLALLAPGGTLEMATAAIDAGRTLSMPARSAGAAALQSEMTDEDIRATAPLRRGAGQASTVVNTFPVPSRWMASWPRCALYDSWGVSGFIVTDPARSASSAACCRIR